MSDADQTVILDKDAIKTETETEPYLLMVAGLHVGKLYNLTEKVEFIGGRSPDCGIWIEDDTISRKHFKITRVKLNQYEIQDLNSTNGTYVNGKKIKAMQPIALTAGDKIQISKSTVIQFDFFDENRKLSEQKRYDMGVKDAVTGTFNKSYFLQRMNDEFSFSYRQNMPLSVLMLDIDFFKMINDTHGHLAGDQVLREIGHEVSRIIRADDVFCRYGGEEFVIIMRNTECQAAVNLAERIRRQIEQHEIDFDGQKIKVTISLGVSTLVYRNFKDYPALIADADKYLYKSKGAGRNKVSAACLPTI